MMPHYRRLLAELLPVYLLPLLLYENQRV